MPTTCRPPTPASRLQTPASRLQTTDYRLLFSLLLALAATAWIYLPVRGFGFVNFDDPRYVTQNPMVLAGWTVDGLRWAFTTFRTSNWHPLTWLSLMTDVELFGPGPGALHAVSACFHLANVLLVYLAFSLVTGRKWPALLTAALFGVHPLHVESVAWISERKDVLSTFFSLLALMAWARYAQTGRLRGYLGSLALFALALLSKPMPVTLPVVLLLLDAWPLARLKRGPPRLLWEKAPFFLLSLLFSAITLQAQSPMAVPLAARAANALVSYAAYLGRAAWPSGLAAFYPHPGMPPAWEIVLSSLVLAAITLAAVLARKKAPWLAWGWAWYLVTLLPVIGLIQVGLQAMADRYTYVPLLGPFLALSWSFLDLFRTFSGRKWTVPAALFLAAFLALTLSARSQVMAWESSVALFESALAHTENNWMAHYSLGTALLEQDQPDQALNHLHAAEKLQPGDAKIANNLGLALESKERYSEALPWFLRAVELDPESWEALANLGNALLRSRDPKQAVSHLLRARTLQPDDGNLASSLGRALFAAGRTGEAETQFRQAIQLLGDSAKLENNLGVTLLAQGRMDEARACFRRALALDPAYPPARTNLAATAARAPDREPGGRTAGSPPAP